MLVADTPAIQLLQFASSQPVLWPGIALLCGAIVAMLTITQLTHREAYRDGGANGGDSRCNNAYSNRRVGAPVVINTRQNLRGTIP